VLEEIGGPAQIAALQKQLIKERLCCKPPEKKQEYPSLMPWCFTKSFVEQCGGCTPDDWLRCSGAAPEFWRRAASVLAGGLADTFGPAASIGVGMLNAALIDAGN